MILSTVLGIIVDKPLISAKKTYHSSSDEHDRKGAFEERFRIRWSFKIESRGEQTVKSIVKRMDKKMVFFYI